MATKYLPLLLICGGATLGLYFGILLGVRTERRKWRRYVNNCMGYLQAEHEYLPPAPPDESWIDEIEYQLSDRSADA